MTTHVSSLVEAFRSLLPPGVGVSAGQFSTKALPLSRSEASSVGVVSADRMRELQSGRTYAKHALAMFGAHDVDLPVASDRSPLWPAGFIGSITHARNHSEGFCAAAVARSQEFVALGVDLEYAVDLDPLIWPSILTAKELSQICNLPVNKRAGEVLSRWCVKEATIKATRCRLEPLLIETDKCDADSYRCALIQGSGVAQGWHAWTSRWHKLVLAAVAVPLQ